MSVLSQSDVTVTNISYRVCLASWQEDSWHRCGAEITLLSPYILRDKVILLYRFVICILPTGKPDIQNIQSTGIYPDVHIIYLFSKFHENQAEKQSAVKTTPPESAVDN